MTVAAPPVILDHHPPSSVLVWPWSAEATVGTLPTAPSAARAFVTEKLSEWGMAGSIGAAIAVASELVTNAVRASWPGCATESITLDLSADGRQLLIEVWDASPCVPEYRPRDEGGRGLVVVAALSQMWGYYSARTGKTVWAYVTSAR